jgi:hypothetical protein
MDNSNGSSPFLVDLVNNVGYNAYLYIQIGGGTIHANIEGCYFKKGPDSYNDNKNGVTGREPNLLYPGSSSHSAHLTDAYYFDAPNSDPWAASGSPNYSVNWRSVNSLTKLSSSPIQYPDPVLNVTTHAAQEGKDQVLQYSGAFPRDSTDLRFIREFNTKSGACQRQPTATMTACPICGKQRTVLIPILLTTTAIMTTTVTRISRNTLTTWLK